MVDILLGLLLAVALLTLLLRDLVAMVLSGSVFGLVACLLYFILHAPDVALTEAAVGTGVGTVIFVWIVRKTERKDMT